MNSEGLPPSYKMSVMIDSWKLATVSMWIEKLPKEEALKLVCDSFTWEELWEGAAEFNQLFAIRNIDKKIPRNIDQRGLHELKCLPAKSNIT